MKFLLLSFSFLFSLHFACGQSTANGKVVVEQFVAASIEGNNAGENPNRTLTVYLPPGYDQSVMRYPVIYFLHGFPIDDSTCMADYDLKHLLDSGIASRRLKPLIMVLPNSYTRFRGSAYTNSPFTGGWADYIGKELSN